MKDINKLRKKVKKELDNKRYQHTLGVMYTAASLAMCYGIEVNKAMVAGLLHDCAKSIPDTDKYKQCEKYHIYLSDIEYRTPELIHAKLGAVLAARLYHIDDKDIQNAIKYHTTGCPDMEILDKIIFISDYIEPERKQLPELQKIRQLAFKNIDEALFIILENTLNYLTKMEKVIDPITEDTYKYYKQQLTRDSV